MRPTSPSSRRRRRGIRGQAALESVFVLVIMLIGFFLLVYYTYLGMAKLVGYHATYVTARSHIVGFEHDIAYRAMEVGSIGLAGKAINPDDLVGLSPLELADREPVLIDEFVASSGYTLDYEHWHKVYANLPLSDDEDMASVRVWVYDYRMGDDDHPMPFGLQDLSVDVNREYWLRMYNHSGFYLE